MKKILFTVIGFMFAVQTAFATPTDGKINLETLNKSDAQVLFQDDMMSQQVILLDKVQMNELKAKGWWGRHVTRHFSRAGRAIQRGLGYINDFFGIGARDSRHIPASERGGSTTSVYDSRGSNYVPIYRGYRAIRHFYYHR